MNTFSKEQCGLTEEEFNRFGMWIVDFIKRTIAPEKSNGAIRRDILAGAVRVNDTQITDAKARIKFDPETQAWVLLLDGGAA